MLTINPHRFRRASEPVPTTFPVYETFGDGIGENHSDEWIDVNVGDGNVIEYQGADGIVLHRGPGGTPGANNGTKLPIGHTFTRGTGKQLGLRMPYKLIGSTGAGYAPNVMFVDGSGDGYAALYSWGDGQWQLARVVGYFLVTIIQTGTLYTPAPPTDWCTLRFSVAPTNVRMQVYDEKHAGVGIEDIAAVGDTLYSTFTHLVISGNTSTDLLYDDIRIQDDYDDFPYPPSGIISN